MKRWEQIKAIRQDMSEFVLHCTKPQQDEIGVEQKSAFEVLKLILDDGWFRATMVIRDQEPVVRGPHPVVCFTEQPLKFFLQSVAVDGRYNAYAVALRKDDLYAYGGRPVIYNNKDVVDTLPPEIQHLWAYYDPTAVWDPKRGEYPIDFTHEREWRAKPNRDKNELLFDDTHGVPLDEVVPLVLPRRGSIPQCCELVLLVNTDKDKHALQQWIAENAPVIGQRGGYYYKNYADRLRLAGRRIVSFDVVRDKGNLCRLEDFLTNADQT